MVSPYLPRRRRSRFVIVHSVQLRVLVRLPAANNSTRAAPECEGSYHRSLGCRRSRQEVHHDRPGLLFRSEFNRTSCKCPVLESNNQPSAIIQTGNCCWRLSATSSGRPQFRFHEGFLQCVRVPQHQLLFGTERNLVGAGKTNETICAQWHRPFRSVCETSFCGVRMS
jgi:hypothetical protein